MKLEKWKLNKNMIKKIIWKSATLSVGVSVFCAVMDLLIKHEFDLRDTVTSCLECFVVMCIMFVIFPWMRKSYGVNDENT